MKRWMTVGLAPVAILLLWPNPRCIMGRLDHVLYMQAAHGILSKKIKA